MAKGVTRTGSRWLAALLATPSAATWGYVRPHETPEGAGNPSSPVGRAGMQLQNLLWHGVSVAFLSPLLGLPTTNKTMRQLARFAIRLCRAAIFKHTLRGALTPT